eukprot:TRINITY_DN1406_c0_g1_i1.p1 TRINITY_DN1406_c0_g1~~TRINITY_DN1406_c0_g1_i1.p1  ORF type:complete len:469 (-),score=62.48 TRINITY_DN1406_c0_g1_i1:66-1472(-)
MPPVCEPAGTTTGFSCDVTVEVPLSGSDLRRALLTAVVNSHSDSLPACLRRCPLSPSSCSCLLQEYHVEVTLPQHVQLLSQYARSKRRTLLLNSPLNRSFFQLLGGEAVTLEIANRRRAKAVVRADMEGTAQLGKEVAKRGAPARSSGRPAHRTLACSSGCPAQITFTPDYLTARASSATTMTVVVDVIWRVNEDLKRSDVIRCFSSASKCYKPGTQDEVTCTKCHAAVSWGSLVKVTPEECTVTEDPRARTEAYHFSVSSLCSALRSHLSCTQVTFGCPVKHVMVFSSVLRLRARLSPLITPTSARSAGSDKAVFVMSVRLCSLSATTPLCVIVRIIRNSHAISLQQWRVMINRGFHHYQSQQAAAPLSFKSVVMTGSVVRSVLEPGRLIVGGNERVQEETQDAPASPCSEEEEEEDQPEPRAWYALHIACYESRDAMLVSSNYTSAMLRNMGTENASQVLSTFCNW